MVNVYLEPGSVAENVLKRWFEDMDNAVESAIIEPVNSMLKHVEKEQIETDFMRAFYGISETGKGLEGHRQWFYDIESLEKIVHKIE